MTDDEMTDADKLRLLGDARRRHGGELEALLCDRCADRIESLQIRMVISVAVGFVLLAFFAFFAFVPRACAEQNQMEPTMANRHEQKLWDEINLLDKLIADLKQQRNDRLRKISAIKKDNAG